MKQKFYLILLFMLPCIVMAQDDKPQAKTDSVKKEAPKKKDLPLEAERKIRIQSTEGTWLSLDVSPDGKTIAFDFMGDIYLLPFSGGKAERFT
ncbi:MAG TPA: hypothetical protein PKC24_07700 [Cyclobacteriaceae bacterium]|nr:hypothetical protein [Cyclobacteriaceae bacterium]